MSKSTTRWPLADAHLVAQGLAQHIAPMTTRVQIAGSIRRGRPDVGDIDLVVEIDPDDPWALGTLIRAIEGMGYRYERGGERILTFEDARTASTGLDVYIATPDTWGITLLCRTGSAAHNVKLVEIGKKRLPARLLKVSRGVVDTAGQVVASKTEEEIFAALGVPFVRPEDREAPEYASWIREDGS